MKIILLGLASVAIALPPRVDAQTDTYLELGRVIVTDAKQENPETHYVLDLTPMHVADPGDHAAVSGTIARELDLPAARAESILGCDLSEDRRACHLGGSPGRALLRLGELEIRGDRATFEVSVITSSEGDPHNPHPVREGRARAELAKSADGIWRVLRWVPTGFVTE